MKPEDVELPEPAATARRWTTNSLTVDMPPWALRTLDDGTTLYTADQVREAIEKAVAQERERCAQLCEPFFFNRACGTGWEQRTPEEIAAAIRSMK